MEKTKNYYKEKAQRIIEYANILSKKFITKEENGRGKDTREFKKGPGRMEKQGGIFSIGDRSGPSRSCHI
ncbi:protein of unknown function [[Clostridium] ultunense Esp]|uniref:Uncharacterized protein n=1 Tax=[Clostridium] ultunense Esp TaxID=1288971 RepID=A0A1M4PL33_9FIRM|nr:hypothetical protein [Schnuerera ultunensis]SHD76137.1 protein of unknown function [[Clostridium] ultunense Esp]